MNTTAHTVRVTCNCDTCKVNAKRIGKPFPLVAFITEGAASMLKITAKNADKASKTHGIVEAAHHPVIGSHQTAAIAG